MIDPETQAKIRALYAEVHALYRQAVKRPSGANCDVCGASDTIGKNGVAYKVRHPVHGYEQRPDQSPKLCHRHASGWALSHNAFNWDRRRSAEEIDLHFAAYLAKQLGDYATSTNKEKQT